MPELPEVETIVRGLQTVLPGRRIVGVRLGKTDFIQDPTALEQHLPGSFIAAIRRYGKFIVFDLASSHRAPPSQALLVHLGMTGRLIIFPQAAPIAPHTHVFFTLDDGRELRYTDIRRFGSMELLPQDVSRSPLAKLGLDPLEASATEFLDRLRGRKAKIKALLLDQRVLRGIGNIYADESLWRAQIHPARLASQLSDQELQRLYRSAQDILKEAIRLRGSSVSDYVGWDGQRGEFQLRHRVYQRTGKKCFRCRAAIKRTVLAGRSSHFCPRCQPAPRAREKSHRLQRQR
jgi:formamidopyrimidine-DNA glycosylase